MGMKVVTDHVSNGKQDGISEIKFPVYGKRQTSDSRYPSAVIYVTFFLFKFYVNGKGGDRFRCKHFNIS